ncbi:MAG: hypothetical protein SGJ11_12845 [Phycisphaerae bacterium]|nr:hypothetical protein [Phycisphaerae bacterium]
MKTAGVDAARAFARVLFVAIGVVLCTACTARGPLAQPVVIGASVSEGTGSVMASGEHAGAEVSLAAAIDASLRPAPRRTLSLADAGMVLDPVGSLQRQVEAARRADATTVIAVDALFWCAYAPAGDAAARSARFEAALAALEPLTVSARGDSELVPVVLGDIPDMDDAVRNAIGARTPFRSDERGALNDRLEHWAATRENVVVLPLAALASAGGTSAVEGSTAPVFARDRLHLTAAGQLVLARLALSALAERGLIRADAVSFNLHENQARLRPPRSFAREESSLPRNRHSAEAQMQRQRAWLATVRASALDAADPDVERAADAIVRRFTPVDADLRSIADPLECRRIVDGRPELREPLSRHLRAMRLAAERTRATNEELVSVLDLALVIGDVNQGQWAAERLAPRVLRDLRSRGSPDIPTALGYALRAYDWHVELHGEVVVALFSDARLAAEAIVARRMSERKKLELAAAAGHRIMLVTRTPAEELQRFSAALRSAGRSAAAEGVALTRHPDV